jgi:hypothetical protein
MHRIVDSPFFEESAGEDKANSSYKPVQNRNLRVNLVRTSSHDHHSCKEAVSGIHNVLERETYPGTELVGD